MNVVNLVGFLGKDPEIRQTPGGKKVARLSLATNKSYKNQQGENVTQTTWHVVVVWGEGTVGYLERNAQQGAKLYVMGEISNRKYEDKDGNTKWAFEIVAERVEVLQKQAKENEPTEEKPVENQSSSSPIGDIDDLPF